MPPFISLNYLVNLSQKKISRLEVSLTLGSAAIFLIGIIIFGWYIFSREDNFDGQDSKVTYNAREEAKKALTAIPKEEWEKLYPDTKVMTLGEVQVLASIANSWPERIQGLSDTPFLPENVVKFFVYDTPGFHSIWMKDMQYSIDIIWLNAEGLIVDIKTEATPESFPESYSPKIEASYVVETVAGFVEKHSLAIGSKATLPIF